MNVPDLTELVYLYRDYELLQEYVHSVCTFVTGYLVWVVYAKSLKEMYS